MSIATTTNSVTLSGDGVTKVFPFAFPIPAVSTLVVTYTDTLGVVTTIAQANYQVTPLNGPWTAGGTVTYPILVGAPAIATGTKLTITRIVSYQQPTSLPNQSGYYPTAIEAALDNLEYQIQQLAAAQAAGAPGVSYFNARTGNVTLTQGDVTTALGFTPLSPANNLSELSNAATARTNLGLGTMAVATASDYATLLSPAFTGAPTVPTAAPGTNTTQAASTAFVIANAVSAGVASFNARVGAVALTSGDVTGALTYTPLAANQNLSDVANAATALSNLGIGWIAMSSVKSHGAKGDNTADDTAAIQATITAVQAAGGGAVFFPDGNYKVTATLTVTANYVALIGASIGGAHIVASGDFGDVVYIHPTGPATSVNNVAVQNLGIITGNDTTNGAGLRLQQCNYSVFSNVLVQDRFGGVLVDSCTHCYFSNILTTADSLWAGTKAGSYLVRINQASGTASTELHFSNCDWRGNSGGKLQYAVWIEQVDGVWFDGLHCGFCYDKAFAILPPSTTASVVSVNCTNLYVDTAGSYGFYMKEFSAGATAECNALINGFNCYNCDRAVMMDHHLGSLVMSDAYSINTQHGIYLNQAIDSMFSNLRITDVNRGATTGYGFYIGTTVRGITIDGLMVRKESFTPTAGLYVDNGAYFLTVGSANFRGCATDIIDISPFVYKRYGTISSDQSEPALTATAGNVLTVPPGGWSTFLLNATNAVSSIDVSSSYDGRTITLVSNGAVTVNALNNLHLTANWTPGVAERTLTITSYSGNWYEVART